MSETRSYPLGVIRTIRSYRRLILRVFILFVSAAAVISFTIPPTYESETTLRIKQPKGLADSLLGDIPAGGLGATKQQMATYAEILKSRAVIEAALGRIVTDGQMRPTYEEMQKRITLQTVKDTEIMKVSVRGRSPEEAQKSADALVESFLGRLTELTRSQQTVIREFIAERLRDAGQELMKAEEALERYKRDHHIFAPEDETRAMLDRLAGLDRLAAENSVVLASNQARLGAAERAIAGEKPGFAADNQLIQQIKAKLTEQEIELAGLIETHTEKHPKVIAVRAAIEETRKKLNVEVAKVVNNEAPSLNPVHQNLLQGKLQAEAEIAAAAAQKKEIGGIIQERERLIAALPAKEQGLARVMRDASVSQEIYVMLAKRFEEARISEVMQPADVQVVDVATVPEKPVSPRKAANILAAGAAGLLIGIGAAFGLEAMNRTIRDAEDVEAWLAIPVLGNIPEFDGELRTSRGTWDSIKRWLGSATVRKEAG